MKVEKIMNWDPQFEDYSTKAIVDIKESVIEYICQRVALSIKRDANGKIIATLDQVEEIKDFLTDFYRGREVPTVEDVMITASKLYIVEDETMLEVRIKYERNEERQIREHRKPEQDIFTTGIYC